MENQEGVLFESDPLTLSLSEDEITANLSQRVHDAETWWNAKYNLRSVREENESYWVNEPFKDSDLADHQVPYKDNRIFVSEEHLLPIVTANTAAPIVTEHEDSDAARELARNLQRTLQSIWIDTNKKTKGQKIARYLLIGRRIAFGKVVWNSEVGELFAGADGSLNRTGDIDFVIPDPKRVVIEQGANDPDDIPLIAEYVSKPLDELAEKFPQQRDPLFVAARGKNAEAQSWTVITHTEAHFSYRKKGVKKEAIAWKYENVLLDGKNTPFWNYDEYEMGANGEMVSLNYLRKPTKPYVPFTTIVLEDLIDRTSLVEQSANLQDVINKRGRQMVENADQASSGLIVNGTMVEIDDVAKLVGDPAEKLVVKGNVNEAVARLPVQMLGDVVIRDKEDARNEIDQIWGTRDPLRGVSASRTLGQDVMSQRADVSRARPFSEAMEEGFSRVYKLETQIMKTFYDKEMKKGLPDAKSSKYEVFSISNKQIYEGMRISVRAGSMLPDDPLAKEAKTIKIAPMLDPLSLAEGIGHGDPRELADRIMLYKMAPDQYREKYLSSVDSERVDPQALKDIETISAGGSVQLPASISKQYAATIQTFISSPEFSQLPVEIQQKMKDFAMAIIGKAKEAMAVQTGTSDPNDPQNEQATDQGGLLSKIQGMLGLGGGSNG